MIDFPVRVLKSITKKIRDSHVSIIRSTSRGPSGAKFKKLSPRYAKLKLKKYNNSDPNLTASGLLLDQLEVKPPTKSKMTYGIKSGAVHPRNKGTISSGLLMNYHQEGTPTMPARDIAGEKVLHNATRDIAIEGLVNQVAKNIEKALKPYKVDLEI